VSELTVYTKPGCPYCAAAKDDFERKGVQYTEHDVKADAGALKQMLELNDGQRKVPTIVQGDQVTVGFNGY
jgi:glutaredoxin 3